MSMKMVLQVGGVLSIVLAFVLVSLALFFDLDIRVTIAAALGLVAGFVALSVEESR